MAPWTLLRISTRLGPYICSRCALRASRAFHGIAARKSTLQTQGVELKVTDDENQKSEWKARRSAIRQGKQKSMLTILEERGLVQTITGPRDEFDRMLTTYRTGAYVGVDPTASSLHIGHMIPFMALFWMYLHGYYTISLVGGATASIGDPTDRLQSRETQSLNTQQRNKRKMQAQLRKLWSNVDAYGVLHGYKSNTGRKYEVLDNSMWLHKLPLIVFLQTLGSSMRLGPMLARDTVKNKMSKGDGMSFAEFSYPLLQAWDWYRMFRHHHVYMQIGGSDQFGNITAGLDALKHMIKSSLKQEGLKLEGSGPSGFTVPLLTTSSGEKFGKSAGNAIWLDREQTSSFELYKFFLGTADADCARFLKMFTFLPLEDIDKLVEEHMKSPEKRLAQHKLAHEFVTLVHGQEVAEETAQAHRLLFRNSSADLSTSITNHLTLPVDLVRRANLGAILRGMGFVKTGKEGQRLAEAGGCYIGLVGYEASEGSIVWENIRGWTTDMMDHYLSNDRLFFRKSKDQIRVVRVVSDQEYATTGQMYGGMKREWRLDVLNAMRIGDQIREEDKEKVQKLIEEDEEHIRTEAKTQAAKEEKKAAKEQKRQGRKLLFSDFLPSNT